MYVVYCLCLLFSFQFDLETFQDTQTDLRWLAGKSRRGGRKEEEEEEEIDFGFGPFGKKDDAAEMEKLKVGKEKGRRGWRGDRSEDICSMCPGWP